MQKSLILFVFFWTLGIHAQDSDTLKHSVGLELMFNVNEQFGSQVSYRYRINKKYALKASISNNGYQFGSSNNDIKIIDSTSYSSVYSNHNGYTGWIGLGAERYFTLKDNFKLYIGADFLISYGREEREERRDNYTYNDSTDRYENSITIKDTLEYSLKKKTFGLGIGISGGAQIRLSRRYYLTTSLNAYFINDIKVNKEEQGTSYTEKYTCIDGCGENNFKAFLFFQAGIHYKF